MQRLGAGNIGASEMGHLPIGGADGTLAAIAGLPARLKVYLHVNNTNPILCEDSPAGKRSRQRVSSWDTTVRNSSCKEADRARRFAVALGPGAVPG